MPELHSFEFAAMGTACVLHLYAEDSVEAGVVAQAAMDEVFRIEERYSRYRADSVLSGINRIAGQGGTLEVDAETAGLLDYAVACYAKSEGLFDITSGVLRRAWDFSSTNLPAQDEMER